MRKKIKTRRREESGRKRETNKTRKVWKQKCNKRDDREGGR